mgnify:CR=1 FL=1|tara:strand:+ start:540 stop:1775 length:1236 start_codon:yes stop_codon:yes gene_type:complete
MSIKTTRYYDEFLRYFQLANKQQELSNLGNVSHQDSNVGDQLMEQVELYDVVERKFAGFSQIINDAFYGWSEDHPYWDKMKAGNVSKQRLEVAKNWDGKQKQFGLEEWLYIFILHRVCGSAINYATKPSGYHNTILFDLWQADTIEQMTDHVNSRKASFYTSVGYQFPKFPKVPVTNVSEDSFIGMQGFAQPKVVYRKGGDYYLSEYAPRLARELAAFLQKGNKKTLRQVGGFMLDWNVSNGLSRYFFQYAAVVADIADWYPDFVERGSMFYYGTNARECIGYLADPVIKMSKQSDEFLDMVMERIYKDTGSLPYNAEDVACDFIRWSENYVRPGADYAHLDYDNLWSSSTIIDHPYGRQKMMLELGLTETFRGMTSHPSDDKILKEAGMSIEEYKNKIKKWHTINTQIAL